jgi:hypothetical protein
MVVARGWGEGNEELVFNLYLMCVLNGEKVLDRNGDDSYTTM